MKNFGWLFILSEIVNAAPAYKGLGRESVSPQTLQKFRAAALPSDLSQKVQAIIDVRAPGAGILSPDNRSLFFSWRVSGTTQIWRVDGPQHFPVQMTGGEDRTELAGISPDGKYLLLTRDRKGEENPGLYLQSPQGGELKVIQHLPKVQTVPAFISDDSKYVFYLSNDRKPDSYALYRYEISSGEKELLFDKEGLWAVADATRDYQRLLLEKSEGNFAKEYFEFSLSDRQLRPLLGQGEKEEYILQYAADEKTYLVITPKFGEFRRLYQFDGKNFRALSPETNSNVESFSLDQTRRRLMYQVNEEGYTKLFALSAKDYKPIKVPDFPGAEHVLAGSSSRDGRYQVLSISTGKAPESSFIWDTKRGDLKQWVLPSSPEIDTSRFVPAALSYIPARDETLIPTLIYRSEKCFNEACPVIVNFHGGPEGQSKPSFNLFAQLLLQEGFTFVQPNVRGSDGHGKTWLGADDGVKRLNVISDIEDCAHFIRKEFAKNGKIPKVGISGGSYGGYAALMGMNYFAGAYDAGISNVGISNLITFLNNTAPYRRKLRIPEYGDPVKDKAALTQLSPITHVNKIKGPLMLIQGASDPRVPVGEAIQIYEKAKRKKLPVELIIYADEGHGSQKRENQVLTIGHTIRFFKQHLR